MNYKEKYEQALERAQKMQENSNGMILKKWLWGVFPELKESEDERIRKEIVSFLKDFEKDHYKSVNFNSWITWLEKQEEPKDKGEISDGYHTFNELYEYRKLYNAAFFNLLPKELVHKSKRHHDGEECFGGGWFIVMANLPTGQISNHYELKDWDLFQIPERDVADKWDGHTPQDVADRLHKYLLEKQGEKEPCINCINDKGCVTCENGNMKEIETTPKFKVGDWIIFNGLVLHIDEVVNGYYRTTSIGDGIHNSYDWDIDNVARLWTIEDAKDGDVLNSPSHRLIWIYKDNEHYHVCVNMNYVTKNIATDGLIKIPSDACPATKDERTILFEKTKEAGYEWNAEKKEIKRIESNTLDADKVIEWLKITINERAENYGIYKETRLVLPYNSIEDLINDFKEDFGLC